MTQETIEWAKEETYGIYFTPNGITGTKISEKGSRHLDENVGIYNALFLDLDGGKKAEQKAKLLAYPIRPSYVVESKNGFHPYWFVYVGINEQEWRIGMKRLIQFFGADKAACNPSRLMRLPFTWHTKTDDKFFTKVEVWSAKRYEWQEVLVPLPPEKPQFAQRNNSAPKGYIPTPSPQILVPNQRHPTLVEEAGRLYAKQPKEKACDVRERVIRWYEASCKPLKSEWNREANDYCDWVEKKEFGEIVSSSVI